MQVLDSLIDGPLELSNRREGDELSGMMVRYLRTGKEPEPRTDAQRMALAMARPVLEKSRARIEAGSAGGSARASNRASNPPSNTDSNATNGQGSNREGNDASEREGEAPSNPPSNRASDIYSSSSSSSPSFSQGEGCGEGDERIPYAEVVAALNEAAGTHYRASSAKTRRLIRARWAEGYRLEDFRAVAETMAERWGRDPKMRAYLRPETLFGPKFEGYRELARQAEGVGGHDRFAVYA